jgi:hypothetical protein
MRISSRGTVSMGPIGWLIVGPFLLLAVVAYGLVLGTIWLLAALFTAIGKRQRARQR